MFSSHTRIRGCRLGSSLIAKMSWFVRGNYSKVDDIFIGQQGVLQPENYRLIIADNVGKQLFLGLQLQN